MAKSQVSEIIEKSCGARLRSKKIGFLRVAPQIRSNSLRTLAENRCGASAEHAEQLRRREPPIPPSVFLRNTGGGVLRGTPGRRMT